MLKNERVFYIKEHLKLIKEAAFGFVYAKRQKKRRLINKKFKERIMLAVTEVNGCAMCSYVHTKLSLGAGMELSEIRNILGGNHDEVSDYEIVAVVFAQHYADSKENPSPESIETLREFYGYEVAELILNLLKVITLTNSMGINMNFLKERFLFKREKRSNFFRELSIIGLTFILFPLYFIYNIVSGTGRNQQKLLKNLWK